NRVDVYALGIMLFEMLTGQVPFTAKTPAEMGFKHMRVPPPGIRELRPDLPETVDRVIQQALAKERDQRFSTAGEVAVACKAALGLPVSADSSAAFRAVRQQAATHESPPPPTPPQASVPPSLSPPLPTPAARPRQVRPFLIAGILVLLVIAGISFV